VNDPRIDWLGAHRSQLSAWLAWCTDCWNPHRWGGFTLAYSEAYCLALFLS
jgi:hypothetical protein